jgi:tagaturonate reductase
MKQLNRNTANLQEEYPVKVLQFGEGNFLRGFVDWIIDILNEKTDFNGNVHVVQPIENGIIHLLNQQEGLYHVLLNGIREGKRIEEKRLISCISGATNPYKDYKAFLALAENPELEFIISNTTEAGIAFDKADNTLDTLPRSFPGKVTALLYHRYTFFDKAPEKGLKIIPCELIERNGDKLKETILEYAEAFNLPDEFREWIIDNNIFCNTLVDRIVPGFPRDNIKEIQKQLDFEDNLVVKAEPFHLWVIEGPDTVKTSFPAEKAGLDVKFVRDLTPYRTRKVRILNGAHTALVPVAYLKGVRTVREAVDHKSTGSFLRKVIFEEIVPTLDLPKEELEQFANDVLERFQNPFIHHELISISLNSISKYKVRVLPSVLEYYNRKGQLPEKLLHSLAALIVFYKGEWKEERIPLNDTPEILSFFEKVWQKEDVSDIAEIVLSNEDLWGRDLANIKNLANIVQHQILQLLQKEQVDEVKPA